MKAYLAVFIGYKDPLIRREVLKEFNSVKELDNYTKKFKDSSEIKEKYKDIVEEFILYYRDSDIYKERKDEQPIVYLSSYTINKQNAMRFIDTMYKDDKSIVFLKVNELIEKINYIINRISEYNEMFYNIKNPHGINEYTQALGIFRIPFAKYDKDLLYRYLKYDDKKSYDIFLTRIRNYFKSKSEEERYEMLRFNKLDLRNHHLMILEKYNKYKDEELEVEKLRSNEKDRFVTDCDDEYFKEFVNNEKYQELFANYDLDEIMRYSGDKENPLGVRRK